MIVESIVTKYFETCLPVFWVHDPRSDTQYGIGYPKRVAITFLFYYQDAWKKVRENFQTLLEILLIDK